MTITVGVTPAGTGSGDSASIQLAIGSVTSGQLIVIQAAKRYNSVDAAFVSGDCTRVSGATIDGFVLDKTTGGVDAASVYGYSAIWSAIATSSGALTVQVAGAADSVWQVSSVSFNGSWDSSRLEASNGATITAFTSSAGTGSSGNATSSGAAVFVGAAGVNSYVDTGFAKDATYTQIYNDTGASLESYAAGYLIKGAGDTDDWHPSFSNSNNGGFSIVVVYKEGASQSRAPKLMMLGIG